MTKQRKKIAQIARVLRKTARALSSIGGKCEHKRGCHDLNPMDTYSVIALGTHLRQVSARLAAISTQEAEE